MKLSEHKKSTAGSIVVIFLFLLSIALSIHHQKTRIDLDRIERSGKLYINIDDGNFAFEKNGNRLSGFQYEIIKAFADSMDLEIVVNEQSNLKKSINDMLKKRCDLIACLIPNTTEWGDEIAFTHPIFQTREMLVQRIDSTKMPFVTKQYQLADDTIYLSHSSFVQQRLQHLSDEIAAPIHIIVMENKSMEDMIAMVANGAIKYTVCTEQLARQYANNYTNINTALPVGFMQSYGWMVRSESVELKKSMDDFLTYFVGSKAYWDIYRKYGNLNQSMPQ